MENILLLSHSISHYKGELAALGTALIWATTTWVYVGLGKRMSPLVINFSKSAIACLFIVLTLLIGQIPSHLDLMSLALLLLSGVLGVGLGDTAFFAALNRIGARRSLLLESLAPPLSAGMAMLFLGEQLSLQAWIGILLTIAGVTWVVMERSPLVQHQIQPLQGIGFGLLAALGQACGAVLSRAALAESAVEPLWSTLIRLLGGLLVLVGLLSTQPPLEGGQWGSKGLGQWLGYFSALRSPLFLAKLTSTSLLGTYLAIWLQQLALKYTATGIAQALGATSPLFAIPIAMAMGERISLRAVLGVTLSLGGIWLLFGR